MNDYKENEKLIKVINEIMKRNERHTLGNNDLSTSQKPTGWYRDYLINKSSLHADELPEIIDNILDSGVTEISIGIDPSGEIYIPYGIPNEETKTEPAKEAIQSSKPQPPDNADRLIHLLMSKDEGEALLGDLSELYTKIYNQRGERIAKLWFYGQVIRSIWALGGRAIIKGLKLLIVREWIRRFIS